ncbi:MAG: hypothetical protein ACSHWU_08840 [Marinicella sp.]
MVVENAGGSLRHSPHIPLEVFKGLAHFKHGFFGGCNKVWQPSHNAWLL